MKVFVVVGHQKKGSFCHAITQAALEELKIRGHETFFHDLYEEKFDPILPHEEILKEALLPTLVKRHCEEVRKADGFLIVHPNWWGQPPAMLKGWVDRVMRQGVVYEFGPEGVVRGFLKGKSAVVFTTSNTPRDIELKVYGDPLENLWRTCVFGFCGVEKFYRRNFEPIVLSTPEQRKEWLLAARRIVREYF